MKSCLLLSIRPDDFAPNRIKGECYKKHIEIDLGNYEEIKIAFDNNRLSIDWIDNSLDNYDGLILRAAGGNNCSYDQFHDAIVRKYLGKKIILNGRFFTRFPGQLVDSKLAQMTELVNCGLPVVDTRVYGYYDRILDGEKSFPLIIKGMYGTHGNSVFLVQSESELKRSLTKVSPWQALVQKFISGGEDFRVICVGGEVLGVMKRMIGTENSVITNVAAGGRYASIPVTEEVSQITKKAAKALDMDYFGLDLVNDSGNLKIYEVNKAAEFEAFEKVTGVNVAGKIIEYMEKM